MNGCDSHSISGLVTSLSMGPCRNAPIPLSLFGEEEVDSQVFAPVLDLAAPWGGFSLRGQLMASAGPKHAHHAAVRVAPLHAQSEPEPAAAVPGQATTSSSDMELHAADASSAQQSDFAGAAPQTVPEPAASLAAESADSWDTVFTDAPQKLPDAAHPRDELFQAGTESPDEHAASPPAVPSAAALPDALGGSSLQPSPPVSADVVSADVQRLQSSSEQLEVPHASAAIVQTQLGHRTPPGSIDWSSLDFNFGPEEDSHAAVSETSLGRPNDSPQHASVDAEQQSKSAAPDTLHVGAPQNELYSESHAEPQDDLDAEPAAAAEEDDDWDYGEFPEAKEPAQGPVLEATAFSAAATTPPQLEVEAAPSLATGLPSPKLSAQLAPAGSQASAVLSFDQWGRAYSQLERQAARSGSANQPASSARDAEDTAVSFSESSWQAPESSSVDVWASLAALDEAHALGAVSEHAQQQMLGQGAFTDPFAAFESQPEEVSFQHGADVVHFSAEAELELVSFPAPAVDVHAPSGHATAGLQAREVSFHAEQAAEDPQTTMHPEKSTEQRGEASNRVPEPAGSFAPQRSWGDGWADCVAEVVPDQAAWPAAESAGSWRRMQQDDMALEKALGCDRQSALLCLSQVRA